MVTTTSRRAAPYAAALMLLVLEAGCGGGAPPAPCASGVVCTDGLSCAAKQAICIVGLCGNHQVDQGEVCDDGGVIDGDVIDGEHCSANCKSDETCGNTITDWAVGEVCDPPGPNCSLDCKSKLTCGNHQIDPPDEDCDPGIDHVPLETAACNLDCTKVKCGDGKINHTALEQCDRNSDGVPGPDGQSATCNADCTLSACGDHKTNPLDTSVDVRGEECDDGAGNNRTNANCNARCILNVCGDGDRNLTNVGGSPAEDCDFGPVSVPVRADCPWNATRTDCPDLCSHCKFVAANLRVQHWCGDHVTDLGHEVCDQGTKNGAPPSSCLYGDTNCKLCSTNCQSEQTAVGPVCGDGLVNGGYLASGTYYQEDCDSTASLTCGTCSSPASSNPCRSVSIAPARGRITIMTIDGLAGVTFAITGDVAMAPTVFEYIEHGGVVSRAGAVPIEIGAAVNETATNTASAISLSSVGITGIVSGSGVVLSNRQPGVSGNLPIELSPPTTTALQVAAMTGGVGCRTGDACTSSADCVSGSCSTATRRCR